MKRFVLDIVDTSNYIESPDYLIVELKAGAILKIKELAKAAKDNGWVSITDSLELESGAVLSESEMFELEDKNKIERSDISVQMVRETQGFLNSSVLELNVTVSSINFHFTVEVMGDCNEAFKTSDIFDSSWTPVKELEDQGKAPSISTEEKLQGEVQLWIQP
ncbi:hypothetical protein HUO09_17765 [Vibrio sp. Y2-5]|uniref:hypothetical protein n=1 Tax=Vibrio sp. Y2-5 TaxID=2743977 RepID=UPI0016614A52|nr:hypothetical protein [Vibrio sp. Y2-5]MBD0788206.1 hypothetical protein [Vibrio sp. Y2-5]